MCEANKNFVLSGGMSVPRRTLLESGRMRPKLRPLPKRSRKELCLLNRKPEHPYSEPKLGQGFKGTAHKYQRK